MTTAWAAVSGVLRSGSFYMTRRSQEILREEKSDVGFGVRVP